MRYIVIVMSHFNPETPHELSILDYDKKLLTQSVLLALVEARSALAELKGSTSELHNPFALISPPALIKEAMTSNAIENIHTTVQSVMQDAIASEESRSVPNKEVLNYRKALMNGFFSKLPFTSRLVLEVHRNILPKNGGRFRQQPNAIKNFASGETIYTPPRASAIHGLMGNLDNFLNSNDGEDPLIKAIMAHYQFEAIHPFGDGNGRTGRILFVLYLCEKGLLKWPVLFLSGYLLANRDEYYKRLLAVTAENDWEGYLLFMLKGIAKQATKTNELSRRAIFEANKLEEEIKQLPGHAQAHDLVEQLFWFPYIVASVLSKELKIHHTTASRYLTVLKNAGILKDVGMEGKYHVYACPRILKLYE